MLEDREAIWRLFLTYKHHLDRRDFKAYASLFTDDAVWVGNLGKATGPAEIEALLVRTMEVYPSDRERTHHLVMNDADRRRRQRRRDGDVELGVRHPRRRRRPGVRDARPLRRHAACAHRTAGASSAVRPTATSPTSRSTASSDAFALALGERWDRSSAGRADHGVEQYAHVRVRLELDGVDEASDSGPRRAGTARRPCSRRSGHGARRRPSRCPGSRARCRSYGWHRGRRS